ncbi:uncharacterized protein LOC113509102 [Galleria mellonella]|uniref:Uncharacterized protein LOC113509102 n=1 Tax=Galleria mellonella TaxID=7137 RepID=A0A6J1WD97_GALME|nr:uncharacterized protein LOC113509102 [Galleria mellonella]
MKLLLVYVVAITVLADARILPQINYYKYKLFVPTNIENSIGDATEESTNTAVVANNLYIPMDMKTCYNNTCDITCKILGYNHGQCVSTSTCHCFN